MRDRPPRRQIVDRHIIIESAAPVAGVARSLDQPQRDRAREHRAAAVPALADRPAHRHPGRRARPRAQVAGRGVIGIFDLGAAIAGALAAMAHHVARAGAGAVAPARHGPEHGLAFVGIE